jgi:hypothetical protein
MVPSRLIADGGVVLEPRDVMQAAIDAYEDHDLDRCPGYHAPDVFVKDADGNLLMDGVEAVRTRYAKAIRTAPRTAAARASTSGLGFASDNDDITNLLPFLGRRPHLEHGSGP